MAKMLQTSHIYYILKKPICRGPPRTVVVNSYFSMISICIRTYLSRPLFAQINSIKNIHPSMIIFLTLCGLNPFKGFSGMCSTTPSIKFIVMYVATQLPQILSYHLSGITFGTTRFSDIYNRLINLWDTIISLYL